MRDLVALVSRVAESEKRPKREKWGPKILEISQNPQKSPENEKSDPVNKGL
jgi:hypothetical protein